MSESANIPEELREQHHFLVLSMFAHVVSGRPYDGIWHALKAINLPRSAGGPKTSLSDFGLVLRLVSMTLLEAQRNPSYVPLVEMLRDAELLSDDQFRSCCRDTPGTSAGVL
jgi:hypothetical protein